MFVAKALEDTLRRVVLLTVNRSVLLQNTVDDIREGGQFRAFRWLASPISPAVPNAAASSSPSRAQCQTDLPPLAGADHQHGRPAERADIGPRCTSSRLPSQKKIEGYRWQSFTPPAAGKSRRFRGLICHRRSQPAAQRQQTVNGCAIRLPTRKDVRNAFSPVTCTCSYQATIHQLHPSNPFRQWRSPASGRWLYLDRREVLQPLEHF